MRIQLKRHDLRGKEERRGQQLRSGGRSAWIEEVQKIRTPREEKEKACKRPECQTPLSATPSLVLLVFCLLGVFPR